MIPCTVKVTENSTGNNIEGVSVDVWSGDTLTFIQTATTNDEGETIIPLESGTLYTFLFSKDDYLLVPAYQKMSISTPEELDVIGYSILRPSAPSGYVNLYGYVKTLTNEPVVGAKVIVKVLPLPQSKNEILFDKTFITQLTDEAGFYSFLLLPGQKITLTIPTAQFQTSGILPLSGSIEGSLLS